MTYNILIIGQSGRLQYEAIMFLASLRQSTPDFNGQVFVAEPQHNEHWTQNPAITDPEIRGLINALGGKISPLENKYFREYTPMGTRLKRALSCPRASPSSFLIRTY